MMHVAIVGATGAVGIRMVRLLEERNYPLKSVRFLASNRSDLNNRTIDFQGESYPVQAISMNALQGVQLVLSSTPSSVSKEWSPQAVEAGAVVIDNSSAYRMDPNVPLVVPEVNADRLSNHQGIIANPNCSTIQLVVALKPIHDAVRVRKVIVSTYQSASGAGQAGLDELESQLRETMTAGHLSATPNKFPHPLAGNCLPQIDTFLPNGYTKEEEKMINETRKIMGDPSIEMVPTCVRVPVPYSHSESVYLETEQPITPEAARSIWAQAPGIVVLDEPEQAKYPLAAKAAGHDAVYVGRIRAHPGNPNAIAFWCVSDNLRKGAATNAVQIAELLVSKQNEVSSESLTIST